MSISVELIQQYKELSIQEATGTTTYSLRDKLFIYFKSLIKPYDPQFTEFESALVEDETTLIHELTARYGDFVEIGGQDIFYVKIPPRDADKEYYVFIHGLGGNLQEFDQLFERIVEEGYGVFGFDQPGFGLSNPAHEIPNTTLISYRITLDSITKVTHEILTELEITKYFLTGHSYGTQISINLIIKYPEFHKPSKVWLLTPPKTPMPSPGLGLKLYFASTYYFPFLYNYYKKLARLGNITGSSSNFILKFDEDVPQSKIDFVKLSLFRLNLGTCSANFANQMWNWKSFTDEQLANFKEILYSNNIRLSIVDGKYDKVTKNGGELLFKNLGYHNSEFHLLDGGHCIQIDHPQEVCDILLINEQV